MRRRPGHLLVSLSAGLLIAAIATGSLAVLGPAPGGDDAEPLLDLARMVRAASRATRVVRPRPSGALAISAWSETLGLELRGQTLEFGIEEGRLVPRPGRRGLARTPGPPEARVLFQVRRVGAGREVVRVRLYSPPWFLATAATLGSEPSP